jgi:hypothetical protein
VEWGGAFSAYADFAPSVHPPIVCGLELPDVEVLTEAGADRFVASTDFLSPSLGKIGSIRKFRDPFFDGLVVNSDNLS